MPEPILLRSQTSIVYVLTIVIYFFFGWILYSILMSSNDPLANILAVGLACFWLTYSIHVILSLKIVLFYESYMTITELVTRRKTTIQYYELSTFHYVPKTVKSTGRITTKSENDKIKLTTTNGSEIIFREMQFDNFSSMRVMLQKIIRGERIE